MTCCPRFVVFSTNKTDFCDIPVPVIEILLKLVANVLWEISKYLCKNNKPVGTHIVHNLLVLLYFFFWPLRELSVLLPYGFRLPLWYLQTLFTHKSHTVSEINSSERGRQVPISKFELPYFSSNFYAFLFFNVLIFMKSMKSRWRFSGNCHVWLNK